MHVSHCHICHLQMFQSEVALKKTNRREDRAVQHLSLEKELTFLTSLDHPNVLRCLGVVLDPLGAVLELAAHGSLRAVYLEFARVGQVIPAQVIHKTLLDVRLTGGPQVNSIILVSARVFVVVGCGRVGLT